MKIERLLSIVIRIVPVVPLKLQVAAIAPPENAPGKKVLTGATLAPIMLSAPRVCHMANVVKYLIGMRVISGNRH